MNTIKTTQIGMLLMLCWLLSSCNKEEYMPTVAGEAIPYEEESTETFAEVLSKSAYTLFYEAWQHSNMEDFLNYRGYPTNGYTVLVPTNEALQAKGWDSQAIANAGSSQLDTLILQHTFMGAIRESELNERLDSYPAINLIESREYNYIEGRQEKGINGIFTGIFLTTDRVIWPYRQREYLSRKNGELYGNGKKLGNADPLPVRNGALWPISKVLEYPTKTAIEVLESDPRFSIYVGLMRRMDEEKLKIVNQTLPVPVPLMLNDPSFFDFTENLGYSIVPVNRRTNNLYDYTSPVIGTLNCWFIPTNKAFQDAGFNSVDDLWAINARNADPQVVMTGRTTTTDVKWIYHYKTDNDHGNRHAGYHGILQFGSGQQRYRQLHAQWYTCQSGK